MIATEADAPTRATPASPQLSTPLTLKRISPALGVEVSGIDLRQPLSAAQVADLRSALVAHKVLVFRDQDITPAQHVAFAQRFGELEVHPVFPHHADHPELVLLGGDANKRGNENVYHTDVSWREEPSMSSILRCQVCPDVGGDTIWVNMELAYESLPEHRKAQINGLFAVHDIMPAFGSRMSPEARAAARTQYPPVSHPVVRTHPESGNKILYVNPAFVTQLENFTAINRVRGGFETHSEHRDLLEYLYRQATYPEYQMRLRWAPNTIAMWDNRSTQHYAIQDYFPAVRRMMRATVIGDKPF
jgi:taurine dioxygenase